MKEKKVKKIKKIFKKIEEETDKQLDLIRSQRSKELEKIKGVDRFYDGSDQKNNRIRKWGYKRNYR